MQRTHEGRGECWWLVAVWLVGAGLKPAPTTLASISPSEERFARCAWGLVWGGVKSERLNFVMGFGGVMVGLTLGFSTSDCHAPDACACGSAHFGGYPGWRFEGKGQWDGG